MEASVLPWVGVAGLLHVEVRGGVWEELAHVEVRGGVWEELAHVEVRGCVGEELPHVRGQGRRPRAPVCDSASLGQRRSSREELARVEVRGGIWEELAHVEVRGGGRELAHVQGAVALRGAGEPRGVIPR